MQNQERLKPTEEKNEEERVKVEELRGTPMGVGTLEEVRTHPPSQIHTRTHLHIHTHIELSLLLDHRRQPRHRVVHNGA